MKKLIPYILTISVFLMMGMLQPSIWKTVDGKLRTSSAPYSWDIAVGKVANHTSVNKFGHTSDADNDEEVWDGATTYEYLNDDTFAVMYISSDNGADQGIDYNVQGIDSEYNHASVTCTTDVTDGNTFVTCNSGSSGGSANQWWRIYRVKCIDVTTNSRTRCATGNIYISKDNTDVGGDGVPDTATDIQAKVMPAFNQTEMAMFTIPTGKTGYLSSFYAGAVSNQDVHIGLYVREFGQPQQNKKIILVNANTSTLPYDFPITIPAKSDISIIAIQSSNADMSAGFDLWYE